MPLNWVAPARFEKKANAGGGLDDTTASTPNLAIKSMLQIRTLICSVVRPPIEFCGQHWRHQGQLPCPALHGRPGRASAAEATWGSTAPQCFYPLIWIPSGSLPWP